MKSCGCIERHRSSAISGCFMCTAYELRVHKDTIYTSYIKDSR